jgi:hypothetical protein
MQKWQKNEVLAVSLLAIGTRNEAKLKSDVLLELKMKARKKGRKTMKKCENGKLSEAAVVYRRGQSWDEIEQKILARPWMKLLGEEDNKIKEKRKRTANNLFIY